MRLVLTQDCGLGRAGTHVTVSMKQAVFLIQKGYAKPEWRERVVTKHGA
jgi:ribosomal protein L9